MKILIDVNLTPKWKPVLDQMGFDTIHWSEIGDIRAPDEEIMEHAKHGNYIVFTHHLDFGAMLFQTNAKSPSVIQLRCEETRPQFLAEILTHAIEETKNYLS
jgi:predicted nuclease of predicted toxin-antitoxin system